MTKLDFHRFQVRHFSNNFEQSYGYCEDGARPESRSKCPWMYKIHHQAKYQRFVAAILFSVHPYIGTHYRVSLIIMKIHTAL